MTFKFGQGRARDARSSSGVASVESAVIQRSPQFVQDCCSGIELQIKELQTLLKAGSLTQGLLNDRVSSMLERISDLQGRGLESVNPAIKTLIGIKSEHSLDFGGLEYLGKCLEVQTLIFQVSAVSPGQKQNLPQLLNQAILDLNIQSRVISDPRLLEGVSVAEKYFQTVDKYPQSDALEGQRLGTQEQKTNFGFGRRSADSAQTYATPSLGTKSCCDPVAIAADLDLALKMISRGQATQGFIDKTFQRAIESVNDLPLTDPSRSKLAETLQRNINLAELKGYLPLELASSYKNEVTKQSTEQGAKEVRSSAEKTMSVQAELVQVDFRKSASAESSQKNTKEELVRQGLDKQLRAETDRKSTSAENLLFVRLLENSNKENQDSKFSQGPNSMRSEEKVSIVRMVNEIDRLNRHLDRGSLELGFRQAASLSRQLSVADGARLDPAVAEQLQRLSKKIDLMDSSRSVLVKINSTLLESLSRQIKLVLQQRINSQPDIERNKSAIQRALESGKLNLLMNQNHNLVERINRLREALVLQRLYSKELGGKLSSADLAQLKKQEQTLIRRIDNLEKTLERSRNLQQNLIHRILAQIRDSQIPQRLSQADRQIIIKAIDFRTAQLSQMISNLQRQLETIRQLSSRQLDPVLLKNLQMQQRQLERRIALLAKEIDSIKNKRAFLGFKEDNSNLSVINRHLRISKMQDAMIQQRLAVNADLQLRNLTNIRRLLIVVRAEVRNIYKDLLNSATYKLEQVQRSLLSQRLDQLVRQLANRESLTSAEFIRLKRLSEISLMLREGQELSARLLDELLELMSEELEDNTLSISKRRNRRKLKSIADKSKQKAVGYGLELGQHEKVTKRKSPGKLKAAAVGTKLAVNSFNGNAIVAATSTPSRSLDVIQSKEEDDNNNLDVDEAG